MNLASLVAFAACAIGLYTTSDRASADTATPGDAHASVAPATHDGKPVYGLAKHTESAVAAAARSRTLVLDDTPFSFRGIQLGISLDALRASHLVRATPHESTLICETDVPGGDLGMMMKSRASPSVACRWAHRTADGWAPSQAVVAGAPAADHVLRFAHDASGEPLRLYEISFVVDHLTAFDLRDMLASRYGAPRVGGDPALPLLEWENASSTITICLLPDGGRATLTYLLKSVGPHPKAGERTLRISQFDEG
jgi:hypothetical protein